MDDLYKSLTIINSVIIAILPFVFFRRQKFQEMKYKELMDLNVKTHDITVRADNLLVKGLAIDKKEYNRLDYLISRYKKHDENLPQEILSYKKLWEVVMKNNLILKACEKDLFEKSKHIRDAADKLLK